MLENERFRTAKDLSDWAVAAHLQHEPRTLDERILTSAHELRQGLHELLLRIARQESATDADVAWLNHWIRQCRDHVRLAPPSGETAWEWTSEPTSLEFDAGMALLGRVVMSAVELLRSPDRLLLRACANERCGWLFLDRSRKHNRRWCEMRECGGRAKARRYQSRRRAAAAERSPE